MFKKGNIVKDTSDESHFFGKQGEVCRVYPNGTAVVLFPLFMIPSYLFCWSEKKKPIYVTYKGDDLDDLVLEDHWDEGALTVWRAEQIWLRFHHSVYSMKEPFREGSPCMVEGCEETATERGLINVWGTVYPIDMCPEHLERWHAKAVEVGPDLKPADN